MTVHGTVIDKQEISASFISTRKTPSFGSEKIAGICFDTIPGYSFKEHRPAQVALWDDVRKVIDQYFQEQ